MIEPDTSRVPFTALRPLGVKAGDGRHGREGQTGSSRPQRRRRLSLCEPLLPLLTSSRRSQLIATPPDLVGHQKREGEQAEMRDSSRFGGQLPERWIYTQGPEKLIF